MRYLAAFLCVVVVLTGCEKEPPPPPEKEPPPPPTARELHSDAITILTPLAAAAITGTISDGEIESMKSGLKSKVNKFEFEENGEEAKRKVERTVSDGIRSSKEQEEWRLVYAGIQIYKGITSNSDRYDLLEPRAILLMNRPKVKVMGFVENDGELCAFFKVFDPVLRDETDYQCIREGEEFHETLKLIRIIGNQQSVEIMYLPVQESFEELGPRERQRLEGSEEGVSPEMDQLMQQLLKEMEKEMGKALAPKETKSNRRK